MEVRHDESQNDQDQPRGESATSPQEMPASAASPGSAVVFSPVESVNDDPWTDESRRLVEQWHREEPQEMKDYRDELFRLYPDDGDLRGRLWLKRFPSTGRKYTLAEVAKMPAVYARW